MRVRLGPAFPSTANSLLGRTTSKTHRALLLGNHLAQAAFGGDADLGSTDLKLAVLCLPSDQPHAVSDVVNLLDFICILSHRQRATCCVVFRKWCTSRH